MQQLPQLQTKPTGKKLVRNTALALVGAAMVAAVPAIKGHEGLELTAYRDVAKVWTYCYGETLKADGTPVQQGDTATKAQCDARADQRILDFMKQVAIEIKVPVTANVLAAHTSFAYNVGINAYRRSSTLNRTNAGDLAGGCYAMSNWRYVTKGNVKYDCAIKANKCTGLYSRRIEEINLCMEGL